MMTEAYTKHDRIALYLSGGAANSAPSLSLGGGVSTRMVKGMVPLYDVVVPGVIVEDATPENNEGEATIAIAGDVAVYTPPDGLAGAPVTVLPGQRKLLFGADPTKGIRLYRPAGYDFSGVAKFNLVDTLNGVLSMSNITDAQRIAGATHHRAFFVKALASSNAVKLWVSTSGQCSYSLAVEVPVDGEIQIIANSVAPPSGVSWVDAVSEGTCLSLGNLTTDQMKGVWIRRVFPPDGVMSPKETMRLHVQHQGV